MPLTNIFPLPFILALQLTFLLSPHYLLLSFFGTIQYNEQTFSWKEESIIILNWRTQQDTILKNGNTDISDQASISSVHQEIAFFSTLWMTITLSILLINYV